MNPRLRRLADGALALIYPRRAVCMGCGSQAGFERDWLCEDCRVALARGWVGATPPHGTGADGMACAYWYRGPAGGLVRNLKYHGVRRLSEPMARDMARAFEPLQPTGVEWVAPVPMHPRRQRRRGYNHAALLAESVATLLGLPPVNALVRTQNTRQQARLSDEARLHNLDGAIGLAEPVEGRRVLLVDDVCTTGATARACVEALRQGGAASVYLLCFALAERETE